MSDMRMSSGARLLAVEPDPGRREELASALQTAGYEDVSAVESVDDAVAHIQAAPPDLVVVDLDASDAAETVAAIRAVGSSTGPGVLGLLAEVTPAGRRRAAEMGVLDFAFRPIETAELRLRVDNALTNGRLRRLLADRSTRLSDVLRERTSELDMVDESLSLLAAMADFHDDDTDEHASRVGALSGAIARVLALPEAFATMLAQAAPLHDIGKVGISRRILLKPGKLTPPEWMHMMQHVDIGGQILGSARSPVLQLAAEVARTHHERWDGSGYTAGLTAEEIPISGRIVAVADVWDTLTHDRPYRKAWEQERALAEIGAQAGAQFDPRVVEAFCSLDLEALARPRDDDRLVA